MNARATTSGASLGRESLDPRVYGGVDHRGIPFKETHAHDVLFSDFDSFGWFPIDDPDENFAILLLNGRCGACRCDLRQIAPEPDGATVCPTCGAAWKLAAFREEHPKFGPQEQVQRSHPRGSHLPILDARGRVYPLKLASAKPIEDGPRTRGVQLFGAFLLLLVSMCLLPQGLTIFPAFGIILVIALAFGHAVGYQLDTNRARHEAEALLAADRCPCCEQPLNPEPGLVTGHRVCTGCGSAWDPSGAVRRIPILP